MINCKYWQCGFPDEVPRARLVLWNLPQSFVVHPVEQTFKHSQAQSRSPVEQSCEGEATSPVQLHHLYRLNK